MCRGCAAADITHIGFPSVSSGEVKARGGGGENTATGWRNSGWRKAIARVAAAARENMFGAIVRGEGGKVVKSETNAVQKAKANLTSALETPRLSVKAALLTLHPPPFRTAGERCQPHD